MTDGIKLIVGLGNPGREYESTRHNVGAWYINQLANQQKESLQAEKKFFGLISKFNLQNESGWLLQPMTYMNDSGKAVASIVNFYKLLPKQILIAHDELDFPAGTIRLKKSGGHGGHNGLRNIIDCLGSNEFYRLRIGIGHPGHKDHVTPYVLGAPSKHDTQLIEAAILHSLLITDDLVTGNFEKAMRVLSQPITP